MGRSRSTTPAILDPDAIIRFLSDHGPSDRRSIARGLGARDAQRSELRLLLRSLVAEGRIALAKGRRYSVGGALKPVMVLEIAGPDFDGELLARPADWDGPGEPPKIFVAPPKDAGPAFATGERVLARLRPSDDGYNALVLRRLGAGPTEVIGVFRLAEGRGRIDPADRRAKSAFAVDPSHVGNAKPGDLVRAVALPRRAAGLPMARIVERVGHLDDPGAVSLIAIHSHGIPSIFADDVLAEAAKATPPGVIGREDLRAEALITIDGEDARDFDDAVWAEPDTTAENPGGFHLIVAIADVSYYVRPGAPIDRSAYERGNSVYLPDRVVPMLPERLSNDLCSLRPDEDRPVLAAHLWIDTDGELRRHRFTRAMIRSAARLTYEKAQAIKDGELTDGIDPRVIALVSGPLYAAFNALSAARVKRGTLDLDLPEYKVMFDADHKIERITRRQRLASHRLIEEFMITANVAAAEALEERRFPCMYRVHDRPDEAKVEALRQYLESLGIPLARGQVLRSSVFAQILERVRDQPFAAEVNETVLRTQSQAIYSPDNIGHFGLALRRYAHFTSPIRRYADLMVHRSLIGAYELGDGGIDRNAGETFVQAGEHISATERRAVACERNAMERYLTLFLADKVGARFAGRISGVTRFGLFVSLDDIGAQGLVPISTLGTERFQHDEQRHTLTGNRTGTIYRLGDRVEAAVKEASPVTGGLVLGLTAHQGSGAKIAGNRPMANRIGRKQGRSGRRRRG